MDRTLPAQKRPAFYALRRGAWRDYLTLLHPPYTVWHLSYVVLGAAAAPVFRPDRLGWAFLAFFLGVGLSSHALDELHGRPLKTGIPSSVLWGIAAASAAGAVAIGVYGAATVSPSIWPFVIFGVFILGAYTLEWFGGWFHTDFWFAFAWGAFPCATAYWASAVSFNLGAGALAAACFGLSLAQRKLSAQARLLRRKVARAEGVIEFQDGARSRIDETWLLAVPEAALKILAPTVALLAAGWLLLRLQ